MWDENDSFGRWFQGVLALILVPIGLAAEYYDWTRLSGSSYRYGIGGIFGGALYLGYRCARYAITGRGNINRDNY
ncbi:hypothetical protein [Granulicella paludicola]|uniref:hypothetical protein n=1 Tax=Granulicella paludicola TaxID=474951 RepID=UPI0021DF7A26|nr:hypothetical protein [Granulicella paludicola]